MYIVFHSLEFRNHKSFSCVSKTVQLNKWFKSSRLFYFITFPQISINPRRIKPPTNTHKTASKLIKLVGNISQDWINYNHGWDQNQTTVMDGWTRNGKEEKCSHTHTHVNFNRAINPGRHTDTLAFPAVTGTTQMLPAGSHGSSVKRARYCVTHEMFARISPSKIFNCEERCQRWRAVKYSAAFSTAQFNRGQFFVVVGSRVGGIFIFFLNRVVGSLFTSAPGYSRGLTDADGCVDGQNLFCGVLGNIA